MRLNEADLSLPFKMIRPGQSVRYLGIYFKDGAIDARLQYEALIGTMKQRIDSWKDRDLSLHGRVLCLNVFVLSRLWFAAHVVPIEKHVLQQVNGLSRDFLWRGRRGHVSLQRVQKPSSQGGLGLQHVEHQALTLQVKWFARVLNPDGPPWCSLARALLERHLSATRKVSSDLLARSVSQWRLKDTSPL
jgi:hypothetical protein